MITVFHRNKTYYFFIIVIKYAMRTREWGVVHHIIKKLNET